MLGAEELSEASRRSSKAKIELARLGETSGSPKPNELQSIRVLIAGNRLALRIGREEQQKGEAWQQCALEADQGEAEVQCAPFSTQHDDKNRHSFLQDRGFYLVAQQKVFTTP